MPKTKAQKQATVADLTDKLARMKGAVLVDYKGLTVKSAQKIRERSWAEAVDYEVVKKTLLRLALASAGMEGAVDPKNLEGNIGLVVGYSDEVATAKFAAGASKEFETFKILGGLFERQFVDANKVKALASLPSKVELLAKLVGSIKAPISGFVNVLAGNLRGLVQVLDGIRNSKVSV